MLPSSAVILPTASIVPPWVAAMAPLSAMISPEVVLIVPPSDTRPSPAVMLAAWISEPLLEVMEPFVFRSKVTNSFEFSSTDKSPVRSVLPSTPVMARTALSTREISLTPASVTTDMEELSIFRVSTITRPAL